MSRRVLGPWICVAALLIAAPAAAQDAGGVAAPAEPAPAAAETAPLVLGPAALPGGLHAPTATLLPKGMFAFAVRGGAGRRTGLVGAEHKLTRGLGGVGLAYAPASFLSIGLELDGHYDRHGGVSPEGDSNYVGDPRLSLRAARLAGPVLLGVQLGVWAPGKEAPSIATDAISFEGRALAAVAAGPGSVGLAAGYRLDNSAKSVDDAMKYRAHERVSLGVSDFNALVASAYFTLPAGARAFLGVEASADVFVGDGAPGPIVRGGAQGGLHLTRELSLLAFVELAKVPEITGEELAQDDFAVIAYEPAFSGGLSLMGRFGGGARRASPALAKHVTVNQKKEDVVVEEHAELSGVVLDDTGQPVAGATVTAKLKNHTATGTTGEKGEYVISRVPIGRTVNGETTLDDTGCEVTVTVANKKPATTTITLAKGKNHLAGIKVEPLLPPGQIRALVRVRATQRPIKAKIAIEPGGKTVDTDDSGAATIDVPPGQYKATASAPGYKPQTLDVNLDPNGVAIKNFELSK